MAEYIEREAALAALDGVRMNEKAIENALTVVSKIPAADVAPVRHGRWRWCGSDRYNDSFQCSECGKMNMDDSNY